MIGERFGRYQVLRQIAGGRAARVFLASDGDDICAVKAFAPTLGHRADRELQFGRGHVHRAINPVEDRLEIGGGPAVRMPFVPGVQLARWLPIHGGHGAFLAVMDDVLDALGYLHDRGVVHRDVKPENILIGRDDRPVLIDFDLSAAVGEESPGRGWTGTPAYLNPERARGEPASASDDLYSAAVVVYWGMTGVLPFERGPLEDREARRVEPPSRIDARLAPLDLWMERALHPEPEHRFAEANDMRAALRSLRIRFAGWGGSSGG